MLSWLTFLYCLREMFFQIFLNFKDSILIQREPGLKPGILIIGDVCIAVWSTINISGARTKSLRPKAIKWGPVAIISSANLAAHRDHPSCPVSITSINNKMTPISNYNFMMSLDKDLSILSNVRWLERDFSAGKWGTCGHRSQPLHTLHLSPLLSFFFFIWMWVTYQHQLMLVHFPHPVCSP